MNFSQIFTKNSTYTKKARSLAMLWTLLIFLLCFIPGDEVPDLHIPLIDKWVHFVLFGVFSFLWLCAYPSPKLSVRTLVFLCSVLLGWLVEVIQGQLAFLHRAQDNMDTLADAIGGLAGVLLFSLIALRFRKRNTTAN